MVPERNDLRSTLGRVSNYITGAELVIDGGMTGGARPR